MACRIGRCFERVLAHAAQGLDEGFFVAALRGLAQGFVGVQNASITSGTSNDENEGPTTLPGWPGLTGPCRPSRPA
jgi:hypothetical protein